MQFRRDWYSGDAWIGNKWREAVWRSTRGAGDQWANEQIICSLTFCIIARGFLYWNWFNWRTITVHCSFERVFEFLVVKLCSNMTHFTHNYFSIQHCIEIVPCVAHHSAHWTKCTLNTGQLGHYTLDTKWQSSSPLAHRTLLGSAPVPS